LVAFLAFSIPGFAPDEYFQVSNQAGAVMRIIEKRDVERHRRDIYLCKPVGQPGTAGCPPAESEPTTPIPSTFLGDSLAESMMPAKSVTPITGPISLIDHQTPPVSKSSHV